MRLYEFIESNRAKILDATIERLRRSAPDRTGKELLSELPVFVDELVRALRQDAGLDSVSPLPGRSEAAVRHGDQRREIGFEIASIAHDYGLICDLVTELAQQQSETFSSREVQILNLCIDAASATAIDEYFKSHQAAELKLSSERLRFLAHELRNALSSGVTAFDVLKTGRVGIDGKTGQILDRSLKRMDSLIGHILTAARLTSCAKPDRQRLQLAALVREIEAAAPPTRGIERVIEVDPGLELEADPGLLSSALFNLLHNALKFTRDGGRVSIRARSTQEHVTIEIEDECGGLPVGHEQGLFRPVVQQNSDRTGLGLGLAIAREAVEVQGGSVSVSNRPGHGCLFTVEFSIGGLEGQAPG